MRSALRTVVGLAGVVAFGFIANMVGLAKADPRRQAGPSGLFAYVTHYVEQGAIVRQPIVTSRRQMTSVFPRNELFNGVTLLIYWSALNPAENQYQFDLLDEALAYWKARKKQVVLNIATVGNPIRMSKDLGGELQGATPSWVLQNVDTFDADTIVFDLPRVRKERYKYPIFWDPRFVTAASHFIAALGQRYKGNPAVSVVRIGTGFLGEENPETDGKPDRIPGYSPQRWIKYARDIVAAYEGAFGSGTPLEFDLLWSCWIAALGNEADKAAVGQFVDGLVSHGIVIGHNGLRGESARLRRNMSHGHARCLDMLANKSRAGYPVALEMYGPPWSPTMRDTAGIIQVVADVRPRRINFFGTMIPVVNHADGTFDAIRDGPAWQIFEAATKKDNLLPAEEAEKQARMVRELRESINRSRN